MSCVTGRLIFVFALCLAESVLDAPARATPPVTTVITHGFTTGDKGAWVQGMADAICARAGGGSIYRYTEATERWTYVPTAFTNGASDNVVCIFNWAPESDSPDNGPNWNYVQGAGDALYAALRDPVFVGAPVAGGAGPPSSLVENRWLHLIGHSRGACVISETALRFAREGIAVDQLTTLDPHPVNGTLDSPLNFNWNDPTPARWSNVVFHDNYWRADGGWINSADFDGITLSGAFNTQFTESVLDCIGCGYGSGHLNVHLWLHGTVNLAPTPFDGEASITAAMRTNWYPQGFTQRGWYYSRLGGGSASRPAVGAAASPPATRYVMNGDFNNATYAGWNNHGGTVGGQIVNEGGAQFLKIGAGIGSSALGRHNRLFVPPGTSAIKLDSRVLAAANAGGEVLRLTLKDQAGSAYVFANDPIAAASSSWVLNRQFAIPANVPRNRTYTLTAQIVPNAAASAVIGLDNIDLEVLVLNPADINKDGCINAEDLLAIIAGWGPCAPAPQWCQADIDHNSTVDAQDLLAVISAWGCP